MYLLIFWKFLSYIAFKRLNTICHTLLGQTMFKKSRQQNFRLWNLKKKAISTHIILIYAVGNRLFPFLEVLVYLRWYYIIFHYRLFDANCTQPCLTLHLYIPSLHLPVDGLLYIEVIHFIMVCHTCHKMALLSPNQHISG